MDHELRLKVKWDNDYISRDPVEVVFEDAVELVEEFCSLHGGEVMERFEQVQAKKEREREAKRLERKRKLDVQAERLAKIEAEKQQYTCIHEDPARYRDEEVAACCNEGELLGDGFCATCGCRFVAKGVNVPKVQFKPGPGNPVKCCENCYKGCDHFLCNPCYMAWVITIDNNNSNVGVGRRSRQSANR